MHDSETSKAGALDQLGIKPDQRPTGTASNRLVLPGIFVVVGLIAAGGMWWYYNTTGKHIQAALDEKPTEVGLMVVPGTAGGGGSAVVLVGTGEIVSDLQVKVATKVSGQIVKLNVEQGDTVKKDQVLARIEDVTYEALRDEAAAVVKRRASEVARARAELARAESTVIERQAGYEYEKRNYGRLERLRDGGQVGDFEFFTAENNYKAATAALETARAAKESAQKQVDVAEAAQVAAQAQLRLAQKRLDDCAIRAPIDGVVLERNAQIGDFLAAEGGRGANANAQLVEIADMNLMRVEIDVSERDVHRVFADQPAVITPDADRSKAYRGRVLWIDPIGDYARATVEVKVRILEPGPDLRVGGSAKVEFLPAAQHEAQQAPERIWLPKDAVKLTPGSSEAIVFTVVGDRAVANPIRIGTRTDKDVEVLSGIQPGTKIIADHGDEIEDGKLVRVGR